MCVGGALCGFRALVGGLCSLFENSLFQMCRAVALA
jgi:hypothetical protein